MCEKCGYKLGISAQKHWKKLRGYEYLIKILEGTKFKDGEAVETAA